MVAGHHIAAVDTSMAAVNSARRAFIIVHTGAACLGGFRRARGQRGFSTSARIHSKLGI
jgi:hypothetical protein